MDFDALHSFCLFSIMCGHNKVAHQSATIRQFSKSRNAFLVALFLLSHQLKPCSATCSRKATALVSLLFSFTYLRIQYLRSQIYPLGLCLLSTATPTRAVH